MSKVLKLLTKDNKSLIITILVSFGLFANLIIIGGLIASNNEKQQWIDYMTDKIYSQEQKISYYEKLIERSGIDE